MRIGAYVAAETLVAVALLLGVAYGGGQAVLTTRAALQRASSRGAHAPPGSPASLLGRRRDLSAEVAGRRGADPAIEPGSRLALESSGTFLGMSDELLLEPIRKQRAMRMKLNRGGSSLSFRVDFADGSRAAWKPAQTNMQTVPRKEVAAYRINRLLGLDAVPPAVPRAISQAALYELLSPDSAPEVPRIRAEVIVGPGGTISGAASYWIPVIRDSGLDTPAARREGAGWLSLEQPVPQDKRALAAQLSNMAVFDFVIANPDRYSGGNMKMSADGSRLFFMDNTMSFFLDPDGHERTREALLRTQRFSRRLAESLPQLDVPTLRRVLREPDGTDILTGAEIQAVVSRRQIVERHIGDLIARHGEAQVLAFP